MTEPDATPPDRRTSEGYLRLGDEASSGWARARSRCTACGSEGLLDEGFLADTGEGAKGYVRWVAGARDTSLLGGFASLGAERLLVRAFRCRECNHLELFAEPGP